MEKIDKTMTAFATRLPKRLIDALRREKIKTGRAMERVLADILEEKLGGSK